MIISHYFELICFYLLIGTLVGLILEILIRWIGDSVSWVERFWLVTFWPIMVLSLIYYFFIGLFGSDE